jgi:GDP-L-fucose synthase
LFLGSACSYPKICSQPIKEEYLLTGPVEKTSEPFSIAMINGIKMCESYNRQYKTNFIAAVPTNTFGLGDDFSESGHVIAGLIRKFHKAAKERYGKAEVRIWGTGKPKREFLYVDDLAEACLFLMRNYKGSELINIAGGKELSIKKLAGLIQKIAGFKGKIIYEKEKPDGMLRRALDSGKIFKLGWRPKIKLEQGLKLTHQWYAKNYA